jgi:acyl-CoA synthetase (NDP forming)
MLEARSIAVVGATERAGSFGRRLSTEALRSPSKPRVYLVHPRHATVLGNACLPALADVPEPVDLVLLGVPDHALVAQLQVAAERGDAGAVVFGSAPGIGAQLAAAAGDMALCGASCMGFVNVARGVRAIGYLERDPLPVGGIALVSHSGSVFSAMLRTHRRLEYSLAVSSGQELVTHAADYLAYALGLEETRVVGLFLETLRDVPRFRSCLADAAERDVPVVALTVGGSPAGRSLVEAHSGALAGDDAAWEALFAAYGVHRADGLDTFVDSLEAFSIGRRVAASSSSSASPGIATVHDSGAERVLVADVAQRAGVGFADISPSTRARLAGLLGPGLQPVNPLDVWSTGTDTAKLFTECMAALSDDESVAVVVLAVDLVTEYDEDDAYPVAVEALLRHTEKPVVVLGNLASAVDQVLAGRLRTQGVPVLEGTRSGLSALAHLLAGRPHLPVPAVIEEERRGRWRDLLASGRPDHATSLRLLADYGLSTAAACPAGSSGEAVDAAAAAGYPVVLKTDDPTIAHKAAVAGVRLGLHDAESVAAAYGDLASRLGPRVTVQHQVPAGAELYVGLLRDPLVGPLVVVAAGGTLVGLLGARRVALPAFDEAAARAVLGELGVARLLEGSDVRSVVESVLGISQIAAELGDVLEALDVNPLIVTSDGAVAVDALVVPVAAPGSDAAGPRDLGKG